MRYSKLIIAGGALSALFISTDSNATLTGLSAFLEAVGGPGAPPAGGQRNIYRVYADFTSATDRVNAWGAGSDFGAGGILNLNAIGSGPGTGFTNIGGAGGQLAPYSPGTPRDWDTYMTIGVLYGNQAPGGADGTAQIPNTPIFATGTAWIPNPVNGGGVFVTPDMPQGAANYRVSGNDTDHRVLLMQIVVNAGECLAGTLGIAWQPAGPGSGQTVAGLTFDCCPVPGGLQLLAVAGVLGARRRRR